MECEMAHIEYFFIRSTFFEEADKLVVASKSGAKGIE